MVFSSTELIGLAAIAVVVIAIGWAVTRLDHRVGTPSEAELELDHPIEPGKPKKSKRRR